MGGPGERLIVERLGDETLVFDMESNEAHALSGAGAAEFLAADDEVSRRQVLGKLALAGAAASGAGALVRTIVAPSAAHAQSGVPCGVNFCPPSMTCCGITCIPLSTICCNGTACQNGFICCGNTCTLPTACCGGTTQCPGGICCGAANICCPIGFICCGGQCVTPNQCCGGTNPCLIGTCCGTTCCPGQCNGAGTGCA
jgi:hypothetical protein